jgi:nicotinamide mononucleotide transporter
VLIVLLSAVNGWLSGAHSTGAVPYIDALVAWGSVFATWLVARKVLENWFYWIVLDFTAAGLYGSRGLYATALLFILYSAIAVQGYRSWKAGMAPGTVAATAA